MYAKHTFSLVLSGCKIKITVKLSRFAFVVHDYYSSAYLRLDNFLHPCLEHVLTRDALPSAYYHMPEV